MVKMGVDPSVTMVVPTRVRVDVVELYVSTVVKPASKL
jgi:hypothetical protein